MSNAAYNADTITPSPTIDQVDNTNNPPLIIRQIDFDQYVLVGREIENSDRTGAYDRYIDKDVDDDNVGDSQDDVEVDTLLED